MNLSFTPSIYIRRISFLFLAPFFLMFNGKGLVLLHNFTAKEGVRKKLDEIPDDVSFEGIQYHIYVREKIEHGLKIFRKDGHSVKSS